MPRREWGNPITQAAGTISSAIINKKQRDREREEAMAWAKSSGIDKAFPDIAEQVNSGKMSIQAASNAVNQRQEQEKRAAKDSEAKLRELTEKTMQLSNRNATSSDPNATRGNLDLPQFKAMPKGAVAPKVPGGIERPDQRMMQQVQSTQSANPEITPDERLDVLRSKQFPDDEGARTMGGRALSDADARKKMADLQRKTEQLARPMNEKRSPQDIQQAGGSFEASQKYANMTGDQIQQRMLNGEEPEPQRPTWDRQDRINEAKRRGLKPDTPEYFDFVHKEDGAKPAITNAQVSGVARTIMTGLVQERTKQQQNTYAAGPLANATDEDLKTMADSLSGLVTETMQGAVEGMQEVPDEQGAAVQADIQELQSLIKMTKQKLGIR